jgi:hypothetical protein
MAIMRFFTAIKEALISSFKTLGRVLTAPIRFLFGGGGGGYPELDDEPEAVDEELGPDAALRERQQETAMNLARAVTRYAAASVVDDAPAMLPPELTPELKSWCRGLDRDECLALCEASREAVSAHIQRLFMIDGVRAVQPLPTVEWKTASPEYDDAVDLTPAFAI